MFTQEVSSKLALKLIVVTILLVSIPFVIVYIRELPKETEEEYEYIIPGDDYSSYKYQGTDPQPKRIVNPNYK